MPRSAPPCCTYVGVSDARTTTSRKSRRLVPMTSLREVSGSSLGRMPTRASSGAVSSKIRPFDNAMLIAAMSNHPDRYPCEAALETVLGGRILQQGGCSCATLGSHALEPILDGGGAAHRVRTAPPVAGRGVPPAVRSDRPAVRRVRGTESMLAQAPLAGLRQGGRGRGGRREERVVQEAARAGRRPVPGSEHTMH